ncbi:Taurine catabolism dioxygenase TauD/TfdA [Sphingobium chlorophenolicum L-1]|uniref:Taurine catabolism dioxygenase TauD/TfdA n=1 Tax=Sphingobium chlorophenolicum L-1 TaxID=690566 RepID=F6F139_SPHCR|nr:TauD/TfdA family dioxygenase [Sphingobium chlorophenolicum]AEG51255.1 Taurine catabolism dioxygenase TauD/TfdA [Sphingobium chlorophenolicum L-1]
MIISAMPGPFGAIVEGIDLSVPQSDDILRGLIAALHEHQILAIRGQKLTDADYVAFGRQWGRPLMFHLQSHRKDEFPEMIRITNAAATPERYRDGAKFWHQDSSYEAVPASVTMLYGAETPEEGGETLIASTALAYDTLDDAMKARIDGLVGLHCLGGSPALPGEKIPFIPENTARHGIVSHPLVMRHPVTGRKALYLSGSAFGAEGLEIDEGRALINALRTHCTQPQFVTRYKVETGDIFLWDNFQVLHSATPIEYSDEPGKRRLLFRISTKGVPALCDPADLAA